jgi:hypothetical protein
MKLIGIIGTTVLSLTLGVAAPVYAQEEHHGDAQERDSQKQEHREQPQGKQEQAKPEPQRSQPQHESTQKEQPQRSKQQKSSEGKLQQDNQTKQAAKQTNQHEQQKETLSQQKPTAQKQQQPDHAPQQAKAQPKRTPEQQHVQQAAWHQHRSQHWESDHRTWQQRGGYNGYRIPDDRFRGYFGQGHGFRIYGLPFLVVGGYPRFQYDGYWISMVDPYPESWADDWYDTDDVYVAYVDNGYYLYNRRYPTVGIAISVSM